MTMQLLLHGDAPLISPRYMSQYHVSTWNKDIYLGEMSRLLFLVFQDTILIRTPTDQDSILIKTLTDQDSILPTDQDTY